VYDSFESNNLPIFIEDLFKFLGITTWFTYFLRLCWRELNSIIRLSSSHEVF
jgi:cytochrome b561